MASLLLFVYTQDILARISILMKNQNKPYSSHFADYSVILMLNCV